MIEIEIDGKKLEVAPGSTVIEAAHKLGKTVPHFCYHKKLSIAANCRMCLVEIEKAPKPVPACATTVAPGMKVSTYSEKVVQAQRAVMEFLLINHPLDCPVCDQGGECQLQDLAVGYGASASRYTEEKRIVLNKNLGPLIQTDMTRCIHCARCVRFGDEIAGVMELGIAHRGEHAEVMSFLGRTVDSELSGNMIDLCPVGALTSKPFRFSARSWELARRRSVSPHDSLGANLELQTKQGRVVRVLPAENEALNECWLSDRDRFSYEALNSPDRLVAPRLKHGGDWHEVDWPTALDYVVRTLSDIRAEHGAEAIGMLVSPHCTVEEMFLAQKLLRGLGSDNLDSRLRQSDFSLDGHREGAPWLGLPIEDLSRLDSAFVIGSFLRKDHPLMAQRLRQAVRRGGRLMRLHASAEDWAIPLESELLVAPDRFAASLAEVLGALASRLGVSVSAECAPLMPSAFSAQAVSIAEGLLQGERRAVLLGNFALQHPNAASLQALAAEIARLAGAAFGVLGEAANSVGAYLVGALPRTGLNARQMFEKPLKAYVLIGVEPGLDCADGAAARAALASAESVIQLGSFVGEACDYADALLPVSTFAETSGSFVNAEGRVQAFEAAVPPPGDTRPAWKLLRVLGNLFGLEGFEYESSEAVRDEVLAGNVQARLSNAVRGFSPRLDKPASSLQRVADVPIHFADPMVRRAPALQKTRDAAAPSARIHPETLRTLGLASGDIVSLRSDRGELKIACEADMFVAQGCVRLSAAHASTAPLGSLFAELVVERA